MQARYLLGIDAGATKTHYLLYDRVQKRMHLHTGGTANHESLENGFVELEEVLREGIGATLSKCGITPRDIAGAGFGIAGVDTKRQHRIISAIFERIGFLAFGLANDAALGIKAQCLSGGGVCAINGSGFSVYAMDRDDKAVQIGGIGSLTGDKGGGGYLIGRAMAAVYAALFMRGKHTSMIDRAFDLLGITDADDFVEAASERLHGGGDSRAFRRDLSKMLHVCAEEGDAVARDLLIESGHAYADAILGAISRLPKLYEEQKIQIILAGSGFVRCECHLARQTITKRLDAELGQNPYAISIISGDPVLGAILWAHAVAGLPMDAEIARECRALAPR